MERKTYQNPDIGDKVTFIRTSDETNGEYTLVDVELAAGGGNSLHYHRSFSEKFEPLEGDLSVQVGKQQKVLRVGEKYTVAPMILHKFQNKTDKPIKFRVELRPGHTGFENCIKIAYGLASDGRTKKGGMPKEFSHLAIELALSDTNLPGIYTFLTSFLLWRAKRARKQGIEKELMETYCQ
jgi:quercetin dioxygenase-like cupin family protein